MKKQDFNLWKLFYHCNTLSSLYSQQKLFIWVQWNRDTDSSGIFKNMFWNEEWMTPQEV